MMGEISKVFENEEAVIFFDNFSETAYILNLFNFQFFVKLCGFWGEPTKEELKDIKLSDKTINEILKLSTERN